MGIIEHVTKWWAAYLCALAAGLCGAVAGYVRSKFKKQDALVSGVKALLFNEMVKTHADFVKRGYIATHELQNIEYIYKSYMDLCNTNDKTVEKMYKDLCKLENYRKSC